MSDRFAYRKNLEQARKALLDRGDTQYKTATAKEQLDQQGLMRPKVRPPEMSGGMASGIGLALMEAMGEPSEEVSSMSLRPKARPESESAPLVPPEESLTPAYRPGSISPKNMSDREILALTLEAEASGEGMDGMIAAGSVIRNRVELGNYGKGYHGVIMRPGQFSAWNTATGYAKGEGGVDMSRKRASKKALAAADAVLSDSHKDPTGGATHYYNPDEATPDWAPKNKATWLTLGNHLFGKAD